MKLRFDGVKLDHKGLRQILHDPETRAMVHAAAVSVDSRVDHPDSVVDDYTTDRVASSVTIRHPTAKLLQARDGILTRAAAAEGLEVTER